MTYVLLALVFLAAAALLAVTARLDRRRAGRRAAPQIGWRAILLGGAGLMLLTAVFDNIMISVGLFHYADSQILGLRLGRAPVEDFSYPLVALVLLPALWMLFGANRDQHSTQQHSAQQRSRDAR